MPIESINKVLVWKANVRVAKVIVMKKIVYK
jgi:hypothetical protein